MTAEVAVMNKDAVALAADSALTMSGEDGEKVFPSTNKIFALSKYEPIAVMIYGSASLMGIPWEPAIKTFRDDLGNTRFPSVDRYASEFLGFVHRQRKLCPEEPSKNYGRQHIGAVLGFIAESIKEKHGATSSGKSPLDKASVQNGVLAFLGEWKGTERLPGATARHEKQIAPKWSGDIGKIIPQLFRDIPLTRVSRRALVEIGAMSLVKCPKNYYWPTASGIVIAGFGNKEFFPSLRSFSIQGIFEGRLHYRADHKASVEFGNDAFIVPFAQGETVYAFMEGVDPSYQSVILSDMADLLEQYPAVVIDGIKSISKKLKKVLKDRFALARPDVLKEYEMELRKFRRGRFVGPIMRLVSMLPKPELATLAEAMVSLTSMRRKISMDAETVGGPIDVAVISRGDGLVWIKRKHYFDATLNPRFHYNYFRQVRP